MSLQGSWEDLPPLSDERLQEILTRIISWAVDGVNSSLADYVASYRSVWDSKPPLSKATQIRGEFVGRVFDSCGSYDDIQPYTLNNMDYVELEGIMLVIGKVSDPSIPPEESKQLQDARKKRDRERGGQLTFSQISDFPEVMADDVYSEGATPIEELYPLHLVYQCDDIRGGNARISNVYIQDVNRRSEQVRVYVPIDLTLPQVTTVQDAAQEQEDRPRFSLRNTAMESDTGEENTA